MFSSAARLFETQVQAINDLNVFPVPDGDTGTNMYLTLKDVVSGSQKADTDSAGEVARVMASAALNACRGNSGVILYSLFKGIAAGLEGKSDFGLGDLADAFELAREYAYQSVSEPVEGTILTVITSVAQAARDSANADADVQQAFDSICEAAKTTVALTPTMLPVLRDAGVVDAGGQGLYVILEGARASLAGEEIADVQVSASVGVEGNVGSISQKFLQSIEHEEYGYCTNFVIQGEGLDPNAVRSSVAELGRSVVVVGDETTVRVHVHAEDPGPIVSLATSQGTIGQVSIQNMDEQRRELSDARQRETGISANAQQSVSIAVVAVAWGEGIEAVFANDGGASILRAGDTMNPSVGEILDAIKNAPSENVIFLPNNKNIIPAANQALESSDKAVRIIPTRSIPQGIAAVLAFNAESDLDSNAAEMEDAIVGVQTAEICDSVRPVELNGVSVGQGQVIGLLEHELVVAGDKPDEVLLSLLQEANASDAELVTLYWGGPLSQADAERASESVSSHFPNAEVEIVRGAQPYYHYIISIE